MIIVLNIIIRYDGNYLVFKQ